MLHNKIVDFVSIGLVRHLSQLGYFCSSRSVMIDAIRYDKEITVISNKSIIFHITCFVNDRMKQIRISFGRDLFCFSCGRSNFNIDKILKCVTLNLKERIR